MDLDGHKGVALGISEDGEHQEIILNPDTGEVIGERKVSDPMFADIPKGTVTSYSSVTTAVVDHIGAEPHPLIRTPPEHETPARSPGHSFCADVDRE